VIISDKSVVAARSHVLPGQRSGSMRGDGLQKSLTTVIELRPMAVSIGAMDFSLTPDLYFKPHNRRLSTRAD
jgi:hypothetical protein